MSMNPLQFLREHVWSELPLQASTRQRILAAALWGGALLLWAGVKFWRHAHGAQPGSLAWPIVLGVAGAALAAGLLLPASGENIYLIVMRFFSVFGFFLSIMILTVAFYLFVTPLGWALRLGGKDLLDIHGRGKPTWKEHTGRSDRKRYYRLS
jgi:hypothetical protein